MSVYDSDFGKENSVVLETPRLLLRPWQEADAAALYKYASNVKIARDAGWRVHPDETYSKTIIRLMLLRSTAFAIIIKDAIDETVHEVFEKNGSAQNTGRHKAVTLQEGCLRKSFAVEPIGSISIYMGESISRGRAADEGDLGYWLGEPFHNRGYMTEAVSAVMAYAFSNLHVSGLWCSHYPGNEASKAVILKSGFEEHHILEESYNPMLEKKFREVFYYISKVKYQKLHK